MSDWVYSCDRAARSLVELVRLLAAEDLLSAPPDDGLIYQCVRRCGPCGRERGVRRCEGWHTIVDRGVLSFRPLTVPGHETFRLDLSANYSFRRPRPHKAHEWHAQPLAQSTVTLEVFDVASDGLLERYHLDLANRPQAGPVWHLQYGGNPAGGVCPLPTAWLDAPRWPSPPAELVLLAELITYNFFPEEWDALNGRGEWLRLVLEVEQLVMSHFVGHMRDHFDRAPGRRDRTWLAAQDNLGGGLDPRP